MRESPRQCHHIWVNLQDPYQSPLNVQLRIGTGTFDMNPGSTYQCIHCRARLFIKHRGTLISTFPDSRNFETTLCAVGYITPSLFAASCICGMRYPEIDYYAGPTGREYAFSRMRTHVELCNKHRVCHERHIDFHSPSSARV